MYSCLSDFFGHGVELTIFPQFALDDYSSIEQQTACDRCLEGSTSVLTISLASYIQVEFRLALFCRRSVAHESRGCHFLSVLAVSRPRSSLSSAIDMKALTSEVRKVKDRLPSAFAAEFLTRWWRDPTQVLMGTQTQSVKGSHSWIACSCKDLSPGRTRVKNFSMDPRSSRFHKTFVLPLWTGRNRGNAYIKP